MPVLSARGLSKAFGARAVLEDVTLTIARHERVGLLGDNGAGKSTLLSILAGTEPADGGLIERRRGARFMALEQAPKLPAEASASDVVRAGLGEWSRVKARYDALLVVDTLAMSEGELLAHAGEQAEVATRLEELGGFDVDHRVDHILRKVGVRDLDQLVGTMSGGEQRRVALAQILLSSPDLAILDEPTNHLDTDTIEWLEAFLTEEYRGAVLVVSHDRYFLDAVCQRMFELELGKVYEYTGGYSDYVEAKSIRLEHEARAEQNRMNLVRREQAWLRRGAKARSTKQKARIQRAEALIATEGPKRAEALSLASVGPEIARLGNTILELDDLSLGFGDRVLFEGLTTKLVAGDRLGIVGPNGAGKTTLLKAILGELEPLAGSIVVGKNTKIALLDQSRASVVESWCVFDNVAGFENALAKGGGNATLGDREVTLRVYLEHFGFDGHAQRRAASSLSGGERARVALAMALKEGKNLLILDEPTNDLDTRTLGAVEELLESWPGCALIVSHDRAFLDSVTNGILAFEDGAVVRYAGNYQSYLTQRRAAVKPPPEPPRVATPAKPEPKVAEAAAGMKPLNFNERRELEGLMDKIGALEAEVLRLAEQLSSPALYAGPADEATKVRSAHQTAEAEVARLYARWEELEARSELKGSRGASP
jgi:ATP-binding cassette subfamily F protein uup